MWLLFIIVWSIDEHSAFFLRVGPLKGVDLNVLRLIVYVSLHDLICKQMNRHSSVIKNVYFVLFIIGNKRLQEMMGKKKFFLISDNNYRRVRIDMCKFIDQRDPWCLAVSHLCEHWLSLMLAIKFPLIRTVLNASGIMAKERGAKLYATDERYCLCLCSALT